METGRGKEIFFHEPSKGVPTMMAVAVTAQGDALRLGTPVRSSPPRAGAHRRDRSVCGWRQCRGRDDILSDGKRFVMVRGADPQGAREIVVVQHWLEELTRPLPVK